MGSEAFGIGAVALLISFPFGLLGALLGLAALEERLVRPSEHAAEMHRLLALEDAETIEDAVARMLARNADRPGQRVRASSARRRLARRDRP